MNDKVDNNVGLLNQAAERLLAVVSNPASTEEEVQACLRDFSRQVRDADRRQCEEALAILVRGIHLEHVSGAALLATLCGALIERGLNPEPMVDPLVHRMREVIPRAAQFYNAWRVESLASPVDGEDRGPEAEVARRQYQQEAFDRTAERMPREALAWDLLNSMCGPVTACLAAAPAGRAALRDLLPVLLPLTSKSQAAQWIAKLLGVFDEEPYVAIEPTTGLGIVGKLSGVSDNFQLHTLLMDVFPQRGLPNNARVAPAVVAIARGEGPQQGRQSVLGAWNLYKWQALRADGTLPDAKDFAGSDQWIWGEGSPADIPVLDGHRIILLGPPAYARSWQAQRDFSLLRADIGPDRELPNVEVQEWLKRIAAAPRA